MNGRAFAGLNELKFVLLLGNDCIDKDFHHQEIATVAQAVEAKCAFIETPAVVRSCGKVKFASGMVIGGSKIRRGQWPFLVALHHLEDKTFFCGGSLISTRHVLTGENYTSNNSKLK